MAVDRKAAGDTGEMSEPLMARILWRSRRSVQVQLRSTRSHVRGHYRRNYHVASTPDAFQLRGIGETRWGETRRGERRPFHRAKNRARSCVLPIAVDTSMGKGRGPRELAYHFICILVCRCKSFNYVHHKSRHGPSVCSCARAHVCSRPSSAPLLSRFHPRAHPRGSLLRRKAGYVRRTVG